MTITVDVAEFIRNAVVNNKWLILTQVLAYAGLTSHKLVVYGVCVAIHA
jgi:hypothetical protein